MGLTGLEIFKLLPKTNCKECGYPACLAFAVALAAGKAALEACPHVSDEAKAKLDAASAPPMAKVVVGTGSSAVELGEETELFRHDKRFYHPTAVAFRISDSWDEKRVAGRLAAVQNLAFHRVGQEYRPQMLAVCHDTGQIEPFLGAVKATAATGLALILMSEDTEAMAAAVEAVGNLRPLLFAAGENNCAAMIDLARGSGCPLVIRGRGLEVLASLAERAIAAGLSGLVLDPAPQTEAQALADFTQLRRLAVKRHYRTFGFPVIAFTRSEDDRSESLEASAYITKYASIVVLNHLSKAHLLPLFTWRHNLYTDPQVPVQVEEKIYEVGKPGEDSPVYITTNFSLTYYSVEGEIEGSRVPGFVIPVDTSGLSVLTAYADGRFTAETIAAAITRLDLARRVRHHSIIIPGTVAVLKDKLEELSGWEVIVGPRESGAIPAFARNRYGRQRV